jgi:hypothetical protein
MTTPLRQAMEEFRRAQREHARDVHDRERAEALRLARVRLEQQAGAALRRLPFGVYPVTPERHFAVRRDVELREGHRYRAQTLCGAPSGSPTRGQPAPCLACLHVAERFLLEGPPPLELGL